MEYPVHETILHSVVAPGIVKFICISVSEGKTFTNNNLTVMPCTTKSLLWRGFIFRPTDMGLQVSDSKVFLRYTKGAKHISGWSRRN